MRGIGFRATTGDWHLVVNSDVILNSDYVRHLLDVCATDAKVSSASGKLLRFSRTGDDDIIDSTGIEIYQSRFVWDRGTREPDRGQFEQVEQVFGCCGAAALYRRAALSHVAPDGGIFPEIYFAYYEDVDLAWRLNLAGWRCLYVPQAVARHARGGSTRGSATTRRWVFRNRYVLLARNDRLSEMIRAPRPILSFEGIQLLRLIRYPGLILRVPGIIWSVVRAFAQRRAMKQSGRRDFGLSKVPDMVSPGSGVHVWLRHSRQQCPRVANLHQSFKP